MLRFFRKTQKAAIIVMLCAGLMLFTGMASAYNVYWQSSLTALQAMPGVRPGDKAVVFTDAGDVTLYHFTSNAWTEFNSFSKLGTGSFADHTQGVTKGGTGLTSYAIGDLLYADSTTTLAKLADVAAGKYLRSGGVATAPLWSTLILPNAATQGDVFFASASNTMGVLPDVAAGSYLRSGGVGADPVWSTLTMPITAAAGDLWYGSATNTVSALAKGTAFQQLTMNSGATAPTWASGEALLSGTTIDLSADGNTTLFTVPVGRTAILTKAYLLAAADAGTTTLTIGQAGALTDFLGTQTLSAIDTAGDVGYLAPIPHATTPLIKSYAAGTVIKAVVGSHAGAAGNTLYLFGFVR